MRKLCLMLISDVLCTKGLAGHKIRGKPWPRGPSVLEQVVPASFQTRVCMHMYSVDTEMHLDWTQAATACKPPLAAGA